MTSENISAFLSFLRESESALSIARQNAEEADKQSQDILHAVEFGNYNPKRTSTLIKILHAVRNRRREAKDTIDRLEPVEAWIAENRAVINAISKLLGEVRKVEKKQENRVYVPRTDIMEGLK